MLYYFRVVPEVLFQMSIITLQTTMDAQKECVFVSEKSKIFPSTRLFFAFLLCLCFVALAIGTSNISQSMVCMVKKPESNFTCPLALEPEVQAVPCNHPKQFAWSSIQQGNSYPTKALSTVTCLGLIYSGQNFGSLFMFISGWQADRLNGKWTIVAAMIFIIISNALLPVSAGVSFALVFFLRFVQLERQNMTTVVDLFLLITDLIWGESWKWHIAVSRSDPSLVTISVNLHHTLSDMEIQNQQYTWSICWQNSSISDSSQASEMHFCPQLRLPWSLDGFHRKKDQVRWEL